MSCGIYKITNIINNKAYIGQSIHVEERWKKHKSFPIQNSKYPLYLAFKKYGIENFNFEIIEICPAELLNEKEIYYIKYFDTYNNGYNQTIGGGGTPHCVIKLSDEDILMIYDLLKNNFLTQKEIAEMFNVGQDTISEINHGKTRSFEGYEYPIRKKQYNYCIDCGKILNHGGKRCFICDKKHSRIVERPTREELKNMIRNFSFVEIGKKFNVTDNSIRKWCDSYDLPRTKSEIKKYSDEEWQKK